MCTLEEHIHQLEVHVPRLFSPAGRLLYVGIREGGMIGLPECIQAGHRITILEIWPTNADYARENLDVEKVICGDVRDVDKLCEHFDVAFWYHGPEHIPKEELGATLEKLEAVADFVVLGCPLGNYSQGALCGNPHEQHMATLCTDDLKPLGYHGYASGGNIIAWKDSRA